MCKDQEQINKGDLYYKNRAILENKDKMIK